MDDFLDLALCMKYGKKNKKKRQLHDCQNHEIPQQLFDKLLLRFDYLAWEQG